MSKMYSGGLVLRNSSEEPDSDKSYDFIVIVLISAKILVFDSSNLRNSDLCPKGDCSLAKKRTVQ